MQGGISALAPGQQLGSCRIIRLLGRGGMGEVYLAQHLSLEIPVALKTLRPDLESTDCVERFLREARMCARIQHPNVVTIHDVGHQEGLYYIVMQYVQGRNLAQVVRECEGRVPWRSALRITQLAAGGLHAVHNLNLVHRDVKPSNIMLAKDSRVLLMDFGLVGQEVDSSVARAGRPMGTPPYMSPEQCRGEPLDRRSDIFSLGSTLYSLLSGKEPFEGATELVMAKIAGGESLPRIEHPDPDMPDDVRVLVTKATAYRREDRFATAWDMARAAKKALTASLLAPTPMLKTVAAVTPGAETAKKAPPLDELLPLRSPRERIVDVLPWILVTGAAVAGLLLFVLLFTLAAVAGRGGAEPSADSSPPPRMIHIEPGFAQLGNDPAKVRTFLENHLDGANLQKALAAIADEPQQRVEVPEFWIDQYEVTNAEYAKFVKETRRAPPEHFLGNEPPPGKEDHPVVNVTYDDAEAYARWAGKQLPTREQWVRAFRGDSDRLFPWGDEYRAELANVGDNSAFPSTSPVEDTPGDVSPFGVCNMVGNASEFIRGTTFKRGVDWRVAKGAEYKLPGFFHGIGSCQYFYRPLDVKERGVGFRCVREEP